MIRWDKVGNGLNALGRISPLMDQYCNWVAWERHPHQWRCKALSMSDWPKISKGQQQGISKGLHTQLDIPTRNEVTYLNVLTASTPQFRRHRINPIQRLSESRLWPLSDTIMWLWCLQLLFDAKHYFLEVILLLRTVKVLRLHWTFGLRPSILWLGFCYCSTEHTLVLFQVWVCLPCCLRTQQLFS